MASSKNRAHTVPNLGIRTVTLRDYYDNFNKLTAPSAKDVARQQLLFNIIADGKPLGDRFLETRNDDPFTTTFAKEYHESLAVARVLLAAGEIPVEITTQQVPLPDKLVRFQDGAVRQVETADIVIPQSAQVAGVLEYLNVGLRQRAALDKLFREKLRDRYYSITVKSLPSSKAEAQQCIEELVAEIKRAPSFRLPSRHRPGPSSRICQALDVEYVVRPSSIWGIRIARNTAPSTLSMAVAQYQVVVSDKHDRRYSASPIWLVLYINDSEQEEAALLSSIEPVLRTTSLGQFQRIIVGYEREARVR